MTGLCIQHNAFKVRPCCGVWTDHVFIIQSSVDGHSSNSHSLAIVNGVAVDVGVPVLLVPAFLGFIPLSGINAQYDNIE